MNIFQLTAMQCFFECKQVIIAVIRLGFQPVVYICLQIGVF